MTTFATAAGLIAWRIALAMVLAAQARLAADIANDKAARDAGEGQNTVTIHGPSGPILKHFVAYYKGDMSKPMVDYGDEGNWDVDSFKNEGHFEL